MARDPIIDEVRRAREEEAAKYRFDVKAVLAAAKKRHRPVAVAVGMVKSRREQGGSALSRGAGGRRTFRG